MVRSDPLAVTLACGSVIVSVEDPSVRSVIVMLPLTLVSTGSLKVATSAVFVATFTSLSGG